MSEKRKTVLVTGSSSGIGLDVARGFLEKGFNVVLNGRDEKKLSDAARTLGHEDRIALSAGDIGNKATGDKIVRTAVDSFGGVDVLINNAGIFGLKPFLETTEEDVDRYIHINLKGTYFVSQAAVRQMKKQGGGSIVNIGTVLVFHPTASLPSTAPLITKGGVHALTTSLASELAVDNIRVNAVAAGTIRTPLWGDADVDSFGGTTLMNRVGEVGEITEVVFNLATSSFTTGVIIPVDGGYVNGRS